MTSFESTTIEPAGTDGKYTVTGNLTLRGVTKEIQFPATLKIDNDKLAFDSKIEIKRSQFGMNSKADGIKDDLTMKLTVGVAQVLPTAPGGGGPPPPGAGGGIGGRGGRGRGGGGRGRGGEGRGVRRSSDRPQRPEGGES